MAANLTKEQLKNELISHGVQPPSASSRKDEFIKLYEQHVAPIVSLRGDFSSDEENDANEKIEKIENQAENVAEDGGLICGDINVADLSDEELFAQLQSFGIPVGPIVDTTRCIYQKKLAALLQKGTQEPEQPEPEQSEPHHTNGDNHQVVDEKFSDSEDDASVTELKLELVEDNQPIEEEVVSSETISTPEAVTLIRKRFPDRPASSLNAQPLVDKQGTPTPRPSIHSITSSSQYVYESRRLLDTIDGSSVDGGTKTSSGPSPKSKMIGYYVLLMIVFVVAAYVTYTYANSIEVKSLMVNMKQKLSQYLEKSGEAGPAENMDSSQSNPLPNENVV